MDGAIQIIIMLNKETGRDAPASKGFLALKLINNEQEMNHVVGAYNVI